MKNGRIEMRKVVLVVILTWAVLGQSATLYVSLSGNDSGGDGSITAPFATISHALDTSSAGDTILIRDSNPKCQCDATGVQQ